MNSDLCPKCGAYWLCDCGQPRQGNGSPLMPDSNAMYDTSALQSLPLPDWLVKYIEEHPTALSVSDKVIDKEPWSETAYEIVPVAKE